MTLNRTALAALAVLAMVPPALAHTGVGPVNSFSAGLGHPIFGLDHLLAMIAVGLWAALAAPRAFWIAPAGFLSGMLVGGIAGMAGLSVPGVETLIVASVVVFGLLALFAVKSPAALAFGAAAVFGAAHGLAHGAEMPVGGGVGYAVGFLISTFALHAVGVLAGLGSQRLNLVQAGRVAGGGVAAAGVVLMVL